MGHTYNVCLAPIMSYGMILYKIIDDVPHYLLVQRNYTPDFKEIIRGKFEFNNAMYIEKLISKITLHEINYIEAYPHRTLWNCIERFYKVKKNTQYRDKYRLALENYQKLIDGFNGIKFDELVIKCGANYYLEPDWGFPKGKRNYQGFENDFDCAKREVQEETNINESQYKLWNDYNITETYYGTNSIMYAHKYFVAECPTDLIYYIDPNNKQQVCEIRKMGWYSLKECLEMIRPYHEEKKKILEKVNNDILKKKSIL